ncbi:MAG: AAA family ATPase [Candidatus Omnitrophica bacterium]|nr:AAA family ATPase [Candidatus Omnitrophota bacterium]
MSYYRVIGLEKEPFSTSPDPAFFYQSDKHRAALANLLIEFRLKRGLSIVLGDVGTGKTTLGRKLIQMLRDREGFIFHMVLDPTYPSEDLFFSALIRTLGVSMTAAAPTLVDYREVLERFLLHKSVGERQTVVLIIDEAHKLNALSLEALRILLNYETNEVKLLQLVLMGQMELLPLVTGMRNLMDRISFRCELSPLSLEQTREMIHFRLQEAGYRSPLTLFTDEAVEAIFEYSDGYPRRIAMMAHKALRTLVMQKRRVVDGELVDDLVQQELEAGWFPVRRLQKSSSSV